MLYHCYLEGVCGQECQTSETESACVWPHRSICMHVRVEEWLWQGSTKCGPGTVNISITPAGRDASPPHSILGWCPESLALTSLLGDFDGE